MANYTLTQTGQEVQDILDSVGDLSDLTTSDKTSMVDAVNEVVGNVATNTSAISAKASIGINTTVTLASASWTSSGTLYTQAVTVSGMLATDVPFCQAVCDDDADAEAWGYIIKAESSANTLTFSALDAPSVDLDIVVVVIR